MARVHVFQEARYIKKYGKAKAPWSCAWRDDERRPYKRKIGGKTAARKFAEKIERQLATGDFAAVRRTDWTDFRRQYEADVLAPKAAKTRRNAVCVLNHVERINAPKTLAEVATAKVDKYIATRLSEPGRREATTTSSNTVRKEWEILRAALNRAKAWGLIARLPEPPLPGAQEEGRRVMTAAHFDAIYNVCDVAMQPAGQRYPAGDWWRALLSFLAVSGCRIGETLKIRKEAVDFAANSVTILSGTAKSRKERRLYLPPAKSSPSSRGSSDLARRCLIGRSRSKPCGITSS